MPTILVLHAPEDAVFAERFGADLRVLGAEVLVDAGRLGESRWTPDDGFVPDCVAVVLSKSLASAPAFEQILAGISALRVPAFPLLVEECAIPSVLRPSGLHDVRDPEGRAQAIERLSRRLGLDALDEYGQRVRDPLAGLHGRVDSFCVRPKRWHCIACGHSCDDGNNDYLCFGCGALRPFAGGSATMARCGRCHKWSLARARYCEWCGTRFGSVLSN